MYSTDTFAPKINLLFIVNISSSMKYSKLVFGFIQKYKKCKKFKKDLLYLTNYTALIRARSLIDGIGASQLSALQF